MHIPRPWTMTLVCMTAALLFCVSEPSAEVWPRDLEPPVQGEILALLARSTNLPSGDIELGKVLLEKATAEFSVYRVEFRVGKGGDAQHFGFTVRSADDIRPLYWSRKSSADSATTFERAKSLLEKEILGADRNESLVYGCNRVLDSSACNLRNWKGSIDPPFESYWLFFVDDVPDADWEHACRYVFIRPRDGSLFVRFARTPITILDLQGKISEILKLERISAPTREIKPVEDREQQLPGSAGSSSQEFQIKNGDPNRCYAVIISGGFDAQNNWQRYWGDAAFIYSTLTLKYDYLDDHIHVLMSDGTDPGNDRHLGTQSAPGGFDSSPLDLDGDGDDDIDHSATLSNVQNVFTALQGQLTASDQLFVFVTDHGGQVSGQDVLIWLWNQEQLEDNELATLTAPFPCPVFFAMKQCFSGGFIDDLLGPSRAIATSCRFDESSSNIFPFLPEYGTWSYHWIAAMRGCVPGANPWDDGAAVDADVNDDGLVSFREAYDYAEVRVPAGNHPQYAESPARLGDVLFLNATPIERGLAWLRTVQDPTDGFWSYADGLGTTGNVGVTGLAVVALVNHGVDPTTPGGAVDLALNWILGQQDPVDGFFSDEFHKVYNTSLALWGLAAAMSVYPDPDPPAWVDAVSRGKDYLLSAQWLPANTSDWQYGGLGYNADQRPDLSNHQMAMLGLRAAELVLPGNWQIPAANRDPAIEFTSRCQNSPLLNPDYYPPEHVPSDEGGFIYQPYPGSIYDAYADGHSYGSITGAGMWSLYCCGLDNTDSRIEAGKDWIFAQTDYYTHNPGVVVGWGGGEKYYYYYAMTAMKAFTMLWRSKVVDTRDWYEDFSGELIARQDPAGWWQGISGEPKVFATAEALTALETWATVLTGDARWELSSDADLIVYDPDGNRCRIDYETGVVECNIPGAVCSGPHPSVITISAPQAGGYITQVVGREYGWYRLTTSSHLNGTTVASETHWGWTHEGEIDEWSTVIATVFHPMTLDTDFPPDYPPEPSTVIIPNTEECVNPGEYACLPILLDNNTGPLGGFELEVEFDYTSMTFVGAEPGVLIEGFEKFTYRLLPCPACGCCKYKILLYGQYDMPDGIENIGEPIPLTPIREFATLVNLCFVVNNDENLRGLKIPVCFEWEGTVVNDTLVEDWECGENTFSSWSGDTLFTSNLLCQFNPEICDDPADRIQRILIFQDGICGQNCGGVDVCPAGPGLCKRGDVNMNTITYEVADAVLFASYFVEGTVVFRYDEAYQICATDVNADGRTLTLSDLVYLIRVILHDAVELPKLTPSIDMANVMVSNGIISMECAAPIGAVLFEFDGAVDPTLLADMEMVNKDSKVLVWSSKGKSFTSGEVLSFTGEAELVSVTAVDRDSRELTTSITGKVVPPTFALHPAYPNPFNPFTNLSFDLPEAMNYSLRIYNVTGQLVRSYEDMGSVGLNMITWDSKDNAGVEVASGVYFYKLTAGGFSATEKMVILK